MFANNKNDINEQISAIFDGEDLPHGELVQSRSDAAKKHMQNWSLIGSALRDELPAKIDTNFADSVMAKLELEENVGLAKIKSDLSDQVEVNQKQKYRLINIFKRSAIIATEIAVAASVAVFTVVGWQTYLAGDIGSSYDGSMTAQSLGPIGGINLASYQNNGPHVINLNSASQTPAMQTEALKQMQHKEMQRINTYVKGFVLDNSLK